MLAAAGAVGAGATATAVVATRGDAAPGARRAARGLVAPVDGYCSAAAIEALVPAELAQHLERPLAIEHFYYRFDASPIDGREQRTIERGAIPLVSWNDTDPRTILDGSQDAYVRAAARRFAALPGRLRASAGRWIGRPTP